MGMKYTAENGYVLEHGLLHKILLTHPYFHDAKSDGTSGDELVLPPSIYGKRVHYRILEYEELLDSSNMGMQDWRRIATDISTHYQEYDGFVVVHGTDTLAYTSSALSFMLEGLGKPVVLTGSQIPFSEGRNDAGDNLLGALTIAGHFNIPEVCVYFAHKLFRGNRVIKESAVNLDAFGSPNFKPLASTGVSIDLEWSLVLNRPMDGAFKLKCRLDPNVGAVRFFPGITADVLRAFLAPPIKGVVLESFGTGNLPNNRPDLLSVLKEALDRGVVIVNVSQCRRGSVDPGLYATGRPLYALGAVPGYDMTVECALTKLSFLLGQYDDPMVVKTLMMESLRGELTHNNKSL